MVLVHRLVSSVTSSTGKPRGMPGLPVHGHGCLMQLHGSVIGVLGASGGLGTSTLAVAMASRAARRGWPVAVVDGHLARGGLDVTACLEHLPGLRWSDLVAAEGPLDGPRLLPSLPSAGGLAVLSAGPADAVPVPLPVVEEVVRALAGCCRVLVVDLPASREALAQWLAVCSALVVVVGLSPRGLVDADAACRVGAREVASSWLVVRVHQRRRELAERVAGHLDLPLAGLLPTRPQVALDADRGVVPGSRPRGDLSDVADGVLDAVLGGLLGGVGGVAPEMPGEMPAGVFPTPDEADAGPPIPRWAS